MIPTIRLAGVASQLLSPRTVVITNIHNIWNKCLIAPNLPKNILSKSKSVFQRKLCCCGILFVLSLQSSPEFQCNVVIVFGNFQRVSKGCSFESIFPLSQDGLSLFLIYTRTTTATNSIQPKMQSSVAQHTNVNS